MSIETQEPSEGDQEQEGDFYKAQNNEHRNIFIHLSILLSYYWISTKLKTMSIETSIIKKHNSLNSEFLQSSKQGASKFIKKIFTK